MQNFGEIEKEYSYSQSWKRIVAAIILFGGLAVLAVGMVVIEFDSGYFSTLNLVLLIISTLFISVAVICTIVIAINKLLNEPHLKITNRGILLPKQLKRGVGFIEYSKVRSLYQEPIAEIDRLIVVTEGEKHIIAGNFLPDDSFDEITELLVARANNIFEQTDETGDVLATIQQWKGIEIANDKGEIYLQGKVLKICSDMTALITGVLVEKNSRKDLIKRLKLALDIEYLDDGRIIGRFMIDFEGFFWVQELKDEDLINKLDVYLASGAEPTVEISEASSETSFIDKEIHDGFQREWAEREFYPDWSARE